MACAILRQAVGAERALGQQRGGKLCLALQELQGVSRVHSLPVLVIIGNADTGPRQREHSASIKDAPKAYEAQAPAKAKNIIELDCRGLEFVEFKADVRFPSMSFPPLPPDSFQTTLNSADQ